MDDNCAMVALKYLVTKRNKIFVLSWQEGRYKLSLRRKYSVAQLFAEFPYQ